MNELATTNDRPVIREESGSVDVRENGGIVMAIPAEITRNYRYEYVRVADLKVDPTYHTPERFSEKRALMIARAFDENRVGVITASLRDGAMWLIDGNHRRYAAAVNGITHLYAKVYVGLTQQQEAGIFIGLSAAVPLQPLDLWQARRVDLDPTVIGVERILDKHGVRVVRGGGSAHANRTRAVSALERIYRVDPILLDDTLTLIRTAWPEAGRSTDALPLGAVSSFLYCYRRTLPRADEKRLLDRMSVTTVEELYRGDQLQRATRGGTGGGSVATGTAPSVMVFGTARRALLILYNKGLRHRLPDLTPSDLRAINDGRVADLRGRDE